MKIEIGDSIADIKIDGENAGSLSGILKNRKDVDATDLQGVIEAWHAKNIKTLTDDHRAAVKQMTEAHEAAAAAAREAITKATEQSKKDVSAANAERDEHKKAAGEAQKAMQDMKAAAVGGAST